MLTFRELSEKKSKIKINPKQADLTEKDKKNKEVTCESVDLTEEWINASVEVASEYFYAEGINEDGLDQIIDEVGLEDFVDFVIDPIEELNEERSARKASVKAPSYEKVKAAVDKTDAAKKKAGKGEYSKSYAKRSGETEDSTDYKEKTPAKKKAKPVAKATVRKPKAAPKKKAATVKKVEKAVKTAKKEQPKKPTSKKGLLGKVGDAVKKGVERHNKARAKGREPEKRVKEFAKGFKKGVSGTLKFAGKVKKAVTTEERIAEGLKQARKNVGMDPDKPSCWKGYKATGTKMKGGKKVPDCKKEEVEVVDEKISASGYARAKKWREDQAREKDRKNNPAFYAMQDKIRAAKAKRKGKAEKNLASNMKKEDVDLVDEATRLKKEKGYNKGGSDDKALNFVKTKIRKEIGKPEGQQKKVKGAKSSSGTGKYLKRAQDKKAYVAKAKKAGFKSTQDYTNTVARYGSEDNYKKGKGLGT